MIYSPLSCLRGGKSGVGSSGEEIRCRFIRGGNPVSEGNGTRNFVSRLCNLGETNVVLPGTRIGVYTLQAPSGKEADDAPGYTKVDF